MRKKKKRKTKRSVINLTNAFMAGCSILASYFIVFLSNPFASIRFQEPKDDNIEHSTYRIAKAFEEYNLRRFNP